MDSFNPEQYYREIQEMLKTQDALLEHWKVLSKEEEYHWKEYERLSAQLKLEELANDELYGEIEMRRLALLAWINVQPEASRIQWQARLAALLA